MTAGKKDLPDFFEDHPIDPVGTATGGRPGAIQPAAVRLGTDKKKAGYYLPTVLLNRFDRKYHELKLAGASLVNKSSLLEAALEFALDDMDKGDKSRILKRIL